MNMNKLKILENDIPDDVDLGPYVKTVRSLIHRNHKHQISLLTCDTNNKVTDFLVILEVLANDSDYFEVLFGTKHGIFLLRIDRRYDEKKDRYYFNIKFDWVAMNVNIDEEERIRVSEKIQCYTNLANLRQFEKRHLELALELRKWNINVECMRVRPESFSGSRGGSSYYGTVI